MKKLRNQGLNLVLLLNEYGEKNSLKVSDEEVRAEIQKQIKGMPGQEKMVLDYYKKNPHASQTLKGTIYEEKIISLIKSKIKLEVKKIGTKKAEEIIKKFNSLRSEHSNTKKTQTPNKNKAKSKKISKK